MSLDSCNKDSEWKVENPNRFIDIEEMRGRGNAAAAEIEKVLKRYVDCIIGGEEGLKAVMDQERTRGEQMYVENRLSGLENDTSCEDSGVNVYLSAHAKEDLLSYANSKYSIKLIPEELAPDVWMVNLPGGGFEFERDEGGEINKNIIRFYLSCYTRADGSIAFSHPVPMEICEVRKDLLSSNKWQDILRVEGYNCKALYQNPLCDPDTLKTLEPEIR